MCTRQGEGDLLRQPPPESDRERGHPIEGARPRPPHRAEDLLRPVGLLADSLDNGLGLGRAEVRERPPNVRLLRRSGPP